MLFVHEVHKVVGRRAEAFEDAYRSGWLPALATGTDARLLWYLDLAHGSGPSYRVVTITAVEDGAAWQRLAERVAVGDLRSWARQLDGLQHESRGRVMAPLDWSPSIGAISDLPVEPGGHEPTLYMEDTMWPFPGRLADYMRAAGAVYRPAIDADDSHVRLTMTLALRPLPGTGRASEVTLLQRITSVPLLLALLTNEIPDELTRPGSWMHDALDLRDQWQSRILRSATWSPLP